MALYEKRKQLGPIDRLLTVTQPSVDGPITADGVLKTKWADMTHLKSTKACVRESATPTDFVFKGKCCRIAMTLVVCQSVAAEGQQVEYVAEGSNDGFATAAELAKVIVIGPSEVIAHFDNEVMVNGVAEHFKDVRISVTLNGDPIESYVFLQRGWC